MYIAYNMYIIHNEVNVFSISLKKWQKLVEQGPLHQLIYSVCASEGHSVARERCL